MKRSAPPRRSSPPRARNPARQKREKARTNGSPERDAFVRSLPCCACGVVGYSEVAHVGRKGKGAGRKADYDQTAPLCGPRETFCGIVEGCHRDSHGGQETFAQRWGIDLLSCAAATEAAWLAHLDEEAA